jgi:hypothetical protein
MNTATIEPQSLEKGYGGLGTFATGVRRSSWAPSAGGCDSKCTAAFGKALRLIYLPCHDGLLVIERNQEQSCRTMKFKRTIAAIVLVSAFAAPVVAGTFEDAVDANARGDYAKALRLIRRLANDGDASAQFNLGLMYMTSHGVQQDDAAAARWFRKAAEQGYTLAQSNLGTLHLYGRGVTQDDTEAVMWFRKAADQGDAVSEFLLGDQYANGKGVPRDYVRAYMWFSLSAAQGEQRAVKTLEMAERRMTPAQINEAQRLARDWKSAAQPTPH